MEDILMGLVTDKCSETSFFTSDLPGFEKQPYNIKKNKDKLENLFTSNQVAQ